MNIVVGSGPAGVSCASALLAHGERVLMVDAGVTLEADRQHVIGRMSRQSPTEWAPEDVARMKEGMHVTAGGVAVKRVFGSDFAYRGAAEHIAIQSKGAALVPSLARGGLSNVWGAAMLPYTESDLAGWPINTKDLAPHYAAALQLTGLAGQRDGLAEWFPLHGEPTLLPASRQAARLWRRLEKNAETLRGRGIRFGRSRLAVQASGAGGKPGCIACGMCMYGCPYDFIYQTGWTLRRLRERPGFSYEGGVVVEHLSERGGTVKVAGYHLANDAPWSVEGARVFLGAGVLPSTKILLHSQEAYGHPLPVLDSQYYLFPMLQAAVTRGVREEQLFTLSQLFLELRDAALGEHVVHLQVYSYNDLIGQAVRQTLGPFAWDWLCRELEGRMLIVQGYLHSDYSSRLRVELRHGPRSGQLQLEAEINPTTKNRVRKVVRKLLAQAGKLRALPLEPQLQVMQPGRGFHSGGSLPMRAAPGNFETDVMGRPTGWERVHVVDSSVFPSIPATTITLSVMANAHRIASQVVA